MCFIVFLHSLCSTKWVICDGIEYHKPCILITAVNDDDDSVFARLQEIYVVSAEIYLKVTMQTTVRYSVHFHAYIITSKSPKDYKLIKISDLFKPISTLSKNCKHPHFFWSICCS